MSLVGLISYDSDQDDAADTPIASVDNSFFGKSDDEATTTTMIIDRSNIGLEQSLKTAVTHEKKYPLLSMLPLVNATSATDIQQYEDFDLTNVRVSKYSLLTILFMNLCCLMPDTELTRPKGFSKSLHFNESNLTIKD